MKLLLLVGLWWSIGSGLCAQTIREQVLDVYYNALTQQHQLNTELSKRLSNKKPNLLQEYEKLITLEDQDATLPWTYFIRQLERDKATAALAPLGTQVRKINRLLRRFHQLRLVDPYSQQTIDTSQSVRRLQFFDLREGDKVAEIGFGYGYNLHLLALTYEEIDVYANELNLPQLNRMEKNISEEYPDERRDNFHFVAGAPHSTRLEGEALDLIIMENVLHHIAAPEVFIQSLLRSLQPNGAVVIMEEFLGARPGTKHCPDLMQRNRLEKLFADGHFSLREEETLSGDHKVMLKFQKKKATDWQH